jgi:hypothetical protein
MKLTPEYISSQVLTCGFDYNGTYTVCTITTRHGSKHVGTSGCLDPANYNREIGEQIAHKNALDQLWALEGYVVSKLGLSLVPGELTELSAVAASKAQASTVGTWKRSVSVDFMTARKTGESNPDEPRINIKVNTPSVITSWDAAYPKAGRDVVAVVLANKDKLGLK